MILLCGIPTEPPLAKVIDRCAEFGVRPVVLNQREFERYHLTWIIRGGGIDGQLTIGEMCFDLASFTGIYARLMDDRLLPELDDEPEFSQRRQHCRRFHDGLATWIDLAPGRVVNRFRAMGSNASKPYQAQLIQRHGFLTPETLVTNDPELVRAFLKQHGRVIYKSTSGLRSIVSELGSDDLERLDAIRACPVQFQAHVPGFDVRVHVVNDEVFATRIDSLETDYRYADHGENGTKLEAFDLAEEVADRCRALSRGIELAFTGIDLRITPDGDVYCFEVNPSPAYSYYESHTDQPISLAIARYLSEVE